MTNIKDTPQNKSKCWILFGSEGPGVVTETCGILENDASLWVIVFTSEQGRNELIVLISYQVLLNLEVI